MNDNNVTNDNNVNNDTNVMNVSNAHNVTNDTNDTDSNDVHIVRIVFFSVETFQPLLYEFPCTEDVHPDLVFRYVEGFRYVVV